MKTFHLHLSTAFLGLAAIAVWLGYWAAIRDAAQQRAELPVLRRLSRELNVTDPSAITAVRRRAQWYGEKKWDVFLPSSSSYRICLAMDDLGPNDFPAAETTARLQGGRNEIELRYLKQDQHIVAQIWINGVIAIESARPKAWDNSNGYSTTSDVSASQSFPADQPLKLLNLRLSVPTPTGGGRTHRNADKGVFIWIEPAPPDSAFIQAIPNP